MSDIDEFKQRYYEEPLKGLRIVFKRNGVDPNVSGHLCALALELHGQCKINLFRESHENIFALLNKIINVAHARRVERIRAPILRFPSPPVVFDEQIPGTMCPEPPPSTGLS